MQLTPSPEKTDGDEQVMPAQKSKRPRRRCGAGGLWRREAAVPFVKAPLSAIPGMGEYTRWFSCRRNIRRHHFEDRPPGNMLKYPAFMNAKSSIPAKVAAPSPR